jgi:hypothetical protein
MTAPDWLTRHDGSLNRAPDGRTWIAFVGGAPLYKVAPAPAKGRFECMILQAENGKRIDKGQTYASADEAVRGGLEELRAHLGW